MSVALVSYDKDKVSDDKGPEPTRPLPDWDVVSSATSGYSTSPGRNRHRRGEYVDVKVNKV